MALGWRGQYYRYKDVFLNIVSLYKRRRDLRSFLEVILSVSTIIIFTIFALKPTLLTIISLNNQINSRKQTLVLLNQKIVNLQTADNVFNQNQSLIPDVDFAISNNPQPDIVSKQIIGYALRDHVSLIGISIGQSVLFGENSLPKSTSNQKPLPKGAIAMPISISVKGGYSDLMRFMKDFENLRIPTEIDSVTINSTETQEGNSMVAIISGRIPYLGNH